MPAVRFAPAAYTPSPTCSLSTLPSSPGVMTPPYAYSQMSAMPSGPVTFHPLLVNYNPELRFDVTLPWQNIRGSNQGVFYESATRPEVAELHILHPHLVKHGWVLTITKPADVPYLRVCDVFEGIYRGLRETAAQRDYDSLPPDAQAAVGQAFVGRYSRMPDARSVTQEKHKGLKRVDFLTRGMRFTFAGLAPSKTPGYYDLTIA
ncbi:hypothetical protein MKEN_00768600 [Mycena kentingensis (nom. inval.)]|nr:hypothetical protein MKEN_00768600 [Mycena kentingensis (nom. inval.)]